VTIDNHLLNTLYIVKKCQFPTQVLWIFKGGPCGNIPFIVNFSKRGTNYQKKLNLTLSCLPPPLVTHPTWSPCTHSVNFSFVFLVSNFVTIQYGLFHLYISVFITATRICICICIRWPKSFLINDGCFLKINHIREGGKFFPESDQWLLIFPEKGGNKHLHLYGKLWQLTIIEN